MTKAVLFDLDGTIIDSNEAIFKTYQEVARQIDNPIPSDDDVRKLLGQPSQYNLNHLFGDHPKARDVYNKVVKITHENLQPLPNARKTLMDIKLPKGIVTSKRSDNAKEILGDLIELFDVIVTPEQTTLQKPNPEPIYLACEKLHVSSSETVYVGDTTRDYQTALNAGTGFIGLAHKGSSHSDFESMGLTTIAHSFEEILELLEALQ